MSGDNERPRRRRMREVAAQFGGTESVTTDAPRYDWHDPYHALLAIGWGPFLLGTFVYYLALNAVFGTLYALQPDSVANLPPGQWDRAFFFSVETFATVGYGVMSPQTSYGHIIATMEIFMGLLSSAVLNLIGPMTVCNKRTGTLFHAEAWLTLIHRYQTLEGPMMWRVHDLPLLRNRVQALSLAWTLRHAIDETSPLHGLSNEQLIEMDAQFTISVTGTDAILAAPVHAAHAYAPAELLWGFRFVDVMTVDARGNTRIELARLHEVLPA